MKLTVILSSMTFVVDGVQPRGGRLKPLNLQTVSTTKSSSRYLVGMDGIKRPAAPTPREVVATLQTPVMTAPATEETTVTHWPQPSWRSTVVAWKRPAIAFSLVATALVASTITVRTLAPAQESSVRASTGQAAQSPAPTPAIAAATPAPTPQKTGLQELLNNFVAANPDKFGIVVKDLTTGETASIHGERQITSASLYKLFVAQRIYQRIDLGQLDYGSAAGGGTGRTVESCLRVMINVSDNACGWALGGGILGWGAQDRALNIEGYKQTTLATPQKTSAADVAKLFERLYNGTLISANASERYMALLKDQRVNNRLPKGLPAGTVIAHKTGDLNGVVHDAGIVYGPKTNYVVVVTSGPWGAPAAAPAQFADLSRQLWNYFQN